MIHPKEFRPVVAFPLDEDDQTRADWMLGLLDEQENHTLLIAMPVADDDDHVDRLEDEFCRVYDLARSTGRQLGVKALHGVDDNGRTPGASRVIVVLHEHRWVGGQCVNGCTDTRPVGDDR